MIKKLLRDFYNWVMGNGPRDEDEDHAPERAPNLPFAWVPQIKKSRFHEATIQERLPEWLERQGTGLFSSTYAGLSILTCVLLISLLVLTISGLPERPATSSQSLMASETSEKTEVGVGSVGNVGSSGDTGAGAALEPVMSAHVLPEHVRPRVMGVAVVLFSALTGVCVLYGPRRVVTNPNFGTDWGAFANLNMQSRFSGRMLTGAALFLIGGVTVALGGLPFALGFAGAAVITIALIFYPGLHAPVRELAIKIMGCALATSVIVAIVTDIMPINSVFAVHDVRSGAFPLVSTWLSDMNTSSTFSLAVIALVASVLCACACAASALYGLCLVLAAPDARDPIS